MMKQKRFDELVQNGYLIFMSFFIVFVLLGLVLNNEVLMWLSVILLLYIPAVVCAYCIQGTNDSLKSWKRKRKRARRLVESELLECRNCDKVYNRKELDILSTTIPTCPQCGKKLVPS